MGCDDETDPPRRRHGSGVRTSARAPIQHVPQNAATSSEQGTHQEDKEDNGKEGRKEKSYPALDDIKETLEETGPEGVSPSLIEPAPFQALLRPVHQAEVRSQKHERAEGDAVPRKHREIMT